MTGVEKNVKKKTKRRSVGGGNPVESTPMSHKSKQSTMMDNQSFRTTAEDVEGVGSVEPLQGSAAAIIQIAAYRIDLPPPVLDKVLKRVEEEFIKEEWQLQYLDSLNWQAIGAPIGLVAAVRSFLSHERTTSGSTSICSSSESLSPHMEETTESAAPSQMTNGMTPTNDDDDVNDVNVDDGSELDTRDACTMTTAPSLIAAEARAYARNNTTNRSAENEMNYDENDRNRHSTSGKNGHHQILLESPTVGNTSPKAPLSNIRFPVDPGFSTGRRQRHSMPASIASGSDEHSIRSLLVTDGKNGGGSCEEDTPTSREGRVGPRKLRHSLPALPPRRGTMLVDEKLLQDLNTDWEAADEDSGAVPAFDDSNTKPADEDFVAPPVLPTRQTSTGYFAVANPEEYPPTSSSCSQDFPPVTTTRTTMTNPMEDEQAVVSSLPLQPERRISKQFSLRSSMCSAVSLLESLAMSDLLEEEGEEESCL